MVTIKMTILVTVLVTVSCAAMLENAKTWSKEDTERELAFALITTADGLQTDWMARHDWKWGGKQYHEINPLLGAHPRPDKVRLYFPSAILAHGAVSVILPPKARKWWQWGWIFIEAGAVGNNYGIGARIGW